MASSASTGAEVSLGASGLSKYSIMQPRRSRSRRSIGGQPAVDPAAHLVRDHRVRAAARASASAMLRRRCGVTSELPPPMASWRGVRADDRHARHGLGGSSGRSPSLTSSTVPSAATWRATARRSGSSSSGSSDDVGPTEDAHPRHQAAGRAAPARPRPTRRRRPSRTAAASVGPSQAEGPGISRSSPASAAGAVECVPNQSDITSPSKPHSSPQDAADAGPAARRSRCR